MRGRNLLAVGALVAVLVGVLAFGAFAVTQDQPSGQPGDQGETDGRGWSGHGHGGFGGWGGPDPEEVRRGRTDLAADLGAQLDRSPEQVEVAFRGVVEQRLNEAADAGRVDRADIPAALTAYDEGNVHDAFRILHDDE